MSSSQVEEWLHADKGSPWKRAHGGSLDVIRRQINGRLHRDMGGSTSFDMMRPPQMPYYARAALREEGTSPGYGFVNSAIPGRTDRIGANLPSGSYVIPADVVAGLGEGNSLAGAAVVDKMLHTEPYGTEAPHLTHGEGVRMPPVRPPSLGEGRQIEAMTSGIPQDGGAAKGGKQEMPKAGKHDNGKVGVVIAGGEMVIPPGIIAYHPKLGGLPATDTNPEHYQIALKNGHAVMDALLELAREEHIKTLKKLPGPVKSGGE